MKTACLTAGGFSLFFTTNSGNQLKSETLEKKISYSNDIVTAAGKIDDEISDFLNRYGNHSLRRHDKNVPVNGEARAEPRY